MAILTANTMIRSLATLHLIVAYYFLTNPSTIATHNAVIVLSLAVGLPIPDPDIPSHAMSNPNPVSALLGAVLILSALSDLSASTMDPAFALEYFSSQTPVRLFFFFGLTAWSYSFRPGGLLATRADSEALAEKAGFSSGSPLAKGVGNGLVFTWAFLQVVGWFWVFITLRDERKEAAAREARRKAQ